MLRPEDFARFLQLAGNTIITTSCLGGMQQLADVFLQQGAAYYIGPTEYPEGSASLMYVLEFLYTYLLNGQRVEEAHREASNHSDDRKQFKLYPAKDRPTRSLLVSIGHCVHLINLTTSRKC